MRTFAESPVELSEQLEELPYELRKFAIDVI